jgi:hypothetical protein
MFGGIRRTAGNGPAVQSEPCWYKYRRAPRGRVWL